MDEKKCEFNTLNGGCELSIGGVCKNVLNCYFKENKKLTEQLSIAGEALEEFTNKDYCSQVTNCKYRGTTMTCLECHRLRAGNALAKIEEVKC